MKRFTQGQRVVVTNHADSSLHGLNGTVSRCRMQDLGAWVNMDSDLPETHQSFPAGDTRFRHLLLYPNDCEAI